ncbi:MAG: amino acid adenylation domain-containing protein [Spirochaetales bacterium]|nr:amino acid adenylation domain-containing protein [Spirochaetales bacterium]
MNTNEYEINKLLLSDKYKSEEAYWDAIIDDNMIFPTIPPDFPRKSTKTMMNLEFNLGKTASDNIMVKCNNSELGIFIFIVAILECILYKYNSQNDISIGVPVLSNGSPNVFNDLLILRLSLHQSETFREILNNTKNNVLKVYELQNYPIERVFDKIGMCHYRQHPKILVFLESIHDNKSFNAAAPDCTFKISLKNRLLSLNICFDQEIYSSRKIHCLFSHMEKLIDEVIINPVMRLCEYEILSESEKRLILGPFNQSSVDNPAPKSIIGLFEEQVKKTPFNIALMFQDSFITYREMHEKVGNLASFLRNRGVDKQIVVGIMAERSIEMVIGIYAILKAGGVYLPVDPDYPDERINHIIRDSGMELLLAQNKYLNRAVFSGTMIDLNDETIYQHIGPQPAEVNDHDDLAYIIYTSGSTGIPKGVMVKHRSMLNTLTYLRDRYPVMESDTYMLKTSFTFDVSVTEIFGWFYNGGRLFILDPGYEKDPGKIMHSINSINVTHINFVPSMLKSFLLYAAENGLVISDTLKYVFSAGEALTPDIVRSYFDAGCKAKLENLYGPTEAAIYASSYSIDNLSIKNDPGSFIVPIGKPISNTKLLILNNDYQLQPVGIPGELYIGGINVAKGYINNEQLTMEKFIRLPVSIDTDELYYRTGDVARWLPGGDIIFLGRLDSQVKIRGYRVELGEIESHLLNNEHVKKAVVLANKDGEGDCSLSAYIISDNKIDEKQVRDFLTEKMPAFMIPNNIFLIDEFPLNKSGKINKIELGKMRPKTQREVILPANDTEFILVDLFSQVLGRNKDTIGTNADFFLDLGGDSLTAIKLISKIQARFGMEFPIDEIFNLQTINKIANFIEAGNQKSWLQIEPSVKKEYYPVSPAQKRLFLIQALEPESTAYNLFGKFTLLGPIDGKRFEDAVVSLINRHHVFRTAFFLNETEPVQKIYEPEQVPFCVNYIGESDFISGMDACFRAFDLKKPPLLRISLCIRSAGESILLINIHHIICDGMSLAVLMKDFISLYNNEAVAPLEIQYKDYVEWLYHPSFISKIAEKKAFWDGYMHRPFHRLDLIAGHERPKSSISAYEAKKICHTFDNDVSRALHDLSQKHNTTVYSLMLSCFFVLLSKLTGEDDIVIGSDFSGRMNEELFKLIGMFVNVLPLRSEIANDTVFSDFLRETTQNFYSVFRNQDYPFDELVKDLHIKREINHNPIFDIIFSIDQFDLPETQIGELRAVLDDDLPIKSKFDLIFTFRDNRNSILLTVEYCTAMFDDTMVQEIITYFRRIVNTVIEDCNVAIGDIDLVPNIRNIEGYGLLNENGDFGFN